MKLGQRVKCFGYLKKKKDIPYFIANQEDKHIEENNTIWLSYGEKTDIDLYEIKELEFVGIYVGKTTRGLKREIISDTDGDSSYINTCLIDNKSLARVYYAKNKSRLVPLSLMIEVDK